MKKILLLLAALHHITPIVASSEISSDNSTYDRVLLHPLNIWMASRTHLHPDLEEKEQPIFEETTTKDGLPITAQNIAALNSKGQLQGATFCRIDCKKLFSKKVTSSSTGGYDVRDSTWREVDFKGVDYIAWDFTGAYIELIDNVDGVLFQASIWIDVVIDLNGNKLDGADLTATIWREEAILKYGLRGKGIIPAEHIDWFLKLKNLGVKSELKIHINLIDEISNFLCGKKWSIDLALPKPLKPSQ